MKRLFKFMTILLAIFFILPHLPNASAASKTELAKVKVDILNVREKASAKSKKVGTLKKGAKVTVYTKTKTGWSEIRFNKKKGYVSTQYLDFTKPAVKVTSNKYNKLSVLKYPQIAGLKNKSSEKAVNSALLSHAKRSYQAYVELMNDEAQAKREDEWCWEYPAMCNYDYNLSYKTKYNKGKKLSILYTDYVYSGGAHGLEGVTTYNFNLTNGKRVKLNDILNTKTKRAKVQQYVYNYINKRPQQFFSDVKRSDIKINNGTQFYYAEDGIYIVFQVYEVTAYAYGNPAVKVPASVYK